MNRWLSLALLVGIITAVSIVFYRVMIGFLLPLFLAAILVILFRPMYIWCVRRWNGRERLAALATTAAVVAIVIVPAALLLTFAALEASSIPRRLKDQQIREKLSDLRRKLDLDYRYADEIRYLESSLDSLTTDAETGATAHGDFAAYSRLLGEARQLEIQLGREEVPLQSLPDVTETFERLQVTAEQRLGTIEYQEALRDADDALHQFKVELLGGELKAWMKEAANPTANEIGTVSDRFFAGAPGFIRSFGGATTEFLAKLLVQGAIMILALYFFFIDGPGMLHTIMRLSPLDDAHERELFDEFDRVSRAVVSATLLSAVIQGILAGIGFWTAGVESVFLLSMLTMVFALVPFVGAASVWLPTCLWLYFYEGRMWAAVLLGIYGMVIVSSSDNVIKPYVLHGQSNLHPLLALLSVLGGVQALGPIGILVGPMVVVFLQTLLKILQRELTAMHLSERHVQPPATLPRDAL